MTSKANYARRYNTPLSIAHHLWAEKILHIPAIIGKGPDLYDPLSGRGIELKFTRDKGENKGSMKWTVNEKQFKYDDACSAFCWGFGVYTLSREIRVRNLSPSVLDKYVESRIIYLVHADWVKDNYEGHLTKGTSKTKEWRSVLYYPKFRDLPPVILSRKVPGGEIKITEEVPRELFESVIDFGVPPLNATRENLFGVD